MYSIISNDKKCYLCGYTKDIEYHHVFFGGMRKVSDKNGLTVYLCANHHRGTNGVHGKNGKELNLYLKRCCQIAYEHTHSRADWMNLIKKNYLEV